jgi:hypothetical protein
VRSSSSASAEHRRALVEPELLERAACLGDAPAQVVGPHEQARRELREAEEGERARVAAPRRTIALGERLREHADPRAAPAHRARVGAGPTSDAARHRRGAGGQPVAPRAVTLDQAARHQARQRHAQRVLWQVEQSARLDQRAHRHRLAAQALQEVEDQALGARLHPRNITSIDRFGQSM